MIDTGLLEPIEGLGNRLPIDDESISGAEPVLNCGDATDEGGFFT